MRAQMKIIFITFVLLFNSLALAQTSKSIVFAGGCFWCMQPPYDQLKSQGVLATRVGYAGGNKENPTYEEVSAGNTGHIEVIEVTYNPEKIKLEKLVEVFWQNIDPHNAKGQFCDSGDQYISAFFYSTPEELSLFNKAKEEIQKKLKSPVVTKSLPLKKFYPAEDYHQSYYTKNPVRYKFYRYNCGRDQRLKEVWKK
jgi:peptide-methionine (S)-S-oxide reductase